MYVSKWFADLWCTIPYGFDRNFIIALWVFILRDFCYIYYFCLCNWDCLHYHNFIKIRFLRYILICLLYNFFYYMITFVYDWKTVFKIPYKMQWMLLNILLTLLALYKDCHESSLEREWNFATVWSLIHLVLAFRIMFWNRRWVLSNIWYSWIMIW